MPGKKKEKKAESKSQQRLFGMVTAYKSGKLKLDDLPPSLAKKIKSIADGKRRKTGDKRKNTKGITKKAAKEIASTKHKGLPETVKESYELDRDELIDMIYIYSKYDISDLQSMSDEKLLNLYSKLETVPADEEYEDDMYMETHIKRVSDFLNEDKDDEGYMDALEGGEAEGKTIEDVAKKHNISVEYLEKIISDAIDIEMEHTDDPEVAGRIALDHLWETPLYYDEELGLPEMEEELDDLEDEEVQDIIKKVLKYGESEKTYQEIDKEDDQEIEESKEFKLDSKVQRFEDFKNIKD